MPLVRSVLVVAAIAAAAAASIDRNVTVAQVVNERYEGEVKLNLTKTQFRQAVYDKLRAEQRKVKGKKKSRVLDDEDERFVYNVILGFSDALYPLTPAASARRC
jgi:hypothetical protein